MKILYTTIFRLCVKRWAGLALGVVVAMTYDAGVGVELSEVGEQIDERRLLCQGAGVATFSANVTHTDAVGVVAFTMGSRNVNIAPVVDAAVAIYQVVIAYITPSTFDMVDSALFYGIVLSGLRFGAMNDDVGDGALAPLDSGGYQLCQRCGANDAINLQSVLLLKPLHGLLGVGAIDAVGI